VDRGSQGSSASVGLREKGQLMTLHRRFVATLAAMLAFGAAIIAGPVASNSNPHDQALAQNAQVCNIGSGEIRVRTVGGPWYFLSYKQCMVGYYFTGFTSSVRYLLDSGGSRCYPPGQQMVPGAGRAYITASC
jgi:hypothetical protein